MERKNQQDEIWLPTFAKEWFLSKGLKRDSELTPEMKKECLEYIHKQHFNNFS